MDEHNSKYYSSDIANEASNYGIQGTFNAPVNAQIHVYTGESIIQPGDRKTLLDRVRAAWISGFLEPSLDGGTMIPLGLYERSSLIEHPWQGIRVEIKPREGHLPAGTKITDVYDESDGTLLILGAPGSGKTTLLLQLAKALLDRAVRDRTHRLPVVFNLSTWALKRQPLAEWLCEELNTRYGIPQSMGKVWIAKSQLLFLLDGLDEVAAEQRGACVGAINAYQHQQSHNPLIIGSRMAEYTNQPAKLVVRRAVIAQKLSIQQIHAYLENADGNFEAIQELLRVDSGFQEFAKNPLMLSILKKTYQGKVVQLARSDSVEEQRRQIFADYVESMFKRRGGFARRYSSEQTKYWLIWLAKQMRQQKVTTFYIENLQINWLENSRSTEVSTSLAFGLLTFPVALTVFGMEYTFQGLEPAIVNGILVGLMGSIIAFFFVWLIETGFRVENLFPGMKKQRPARQAEKKSGKWTKLSAFFTPSFWERAAFALLSGTVLGLLVQVLVGPLYALINGLFITAFLIVLGKFESTIQPKAKLVWTLHSLLKHAVPSLFIGLGFGTLGGLFDAYPYFQSMNAFLRTFDFRKLDFMNVFLRTLYFWLCLGVALGIIIMLMRGFTSNELDRKQKAIKPNQGIRNSLSNSLRLGLSTGALVGVVIFFFYSYVMHYVFRVGYIKDIPQNSDVIYGVGDAVTVAYLFGLINGGFAAVQHLMLRVRLWKIGNTPWRYPRFLEHAQERIFLRRVGGGYMFVHKLLLDYFASLEMVEGAYKIKAANEQPEDESLAEETFDDIQEEEEEAETEEPTAPLILIPAISEVPLLLPCGHEQLNPNARFCSICGRPVSAGTFEQ